MRRLSTLCSALAIVALAVIPQSAKAQAACVSGPLATFTGTCTIGGVIFRDWYLAGDINPTATISFFDGADGKPIGFRFNDMLAVSPSDNSFCDYPSTIVNTGLCYANGPSGLSTTYKGGYKSMSFGVTFDATILFAGQSVDCPTGFARTMSNTGISSTLSWDGGTTTTSLPTSMCGGTGYWAINTNLLPTKAPIRLGGSNNFWLGVPLGEGGTIPPSSPTVSTSFILFDVTPSRSPEPVNPGTTVTPEPSTTVLLGAGLLAFAVGVRRRRPVRGD